MCAPRLVRVLCAAMGLFRNVALMARIAIAVGISLGLGWGIIYY